METKEKIEQHKNYKNSVAENLGSLSLAMFAVSLISGVQWATIVLIIFGVISALCGIYLVFPRALKQEWFLRKVATPKTMAIFKRLGWFIVLAMFGYSLIQTGIIWLIIIGIILAILAYVIFYVKVWRLTSKEPRQWTES